MTYRRQPGRPNSRRQTSEPARAFSPPLSPSFARGASNPSPRSGAPDIRLSDNQRYLKTLGDLFEARDSQQQMELDKHFSVGGLSWKLFVNVDPQGRLSLVVSTRIRNSDTLPTTYRAFFRVSFGVMLERNKLLKDSDPSDEIPISTKTSHEEDLNITVDQITHSIGSDRRHAGHTNLSTKMTFVVGITVRFRRTAVKLSGLSGALLKYLESSSPESVFPAPQNLIERQNMHSKLTESHDQNNQLSRALEEHSLAAYEQQERTTHALAQEAIVSRDRLLPRKLIYSGNTPALISPLKFRMMQFNTLADGLSGAFDSRNGKVFARVPNSVLQWSAREDLIVEEILRMNADVICLEEVDRWDEILSRLEDYGYTAEKQEKEFSPNLKIFANSRPFAEIPRDGVAVVYRHDKFQLVERYPFVQQKEKFMVRKSIQSLLKDKLGVEGSSLCALPHANDLKDALRRLQVREMLGEEEVKAILNTGDNDKFFSHVMSVLADRLGFKDHPITLDEFCEYIAEPQTPPAIALRLRVKSPLPDVNVEIVVAATHLYSSKDEVGERVRQEEISALINSAPMRAALADPDVGVFVGCDLNAAPINTKGYSPLAYHVMLGEDEDSARSTHFRSAYRDVIGNGNREPEYTTWKIREKNGVDVQDKHTIDYIFCPKVDWFATSVMGIPEESELNFFLENFKNEDGSLAASPLPNEKYPSDHFSIVADFEYFRGLRQSERFLVNPVPEMPDVELWDRMMEPVEAKCDVDERFSIMQFNILAHGLSGALADNSDKTFLRVPKDVLSWDHRGPRIVKEIKRFLPDIVCLEEVDQFDYLSAALSPTYRGIFKPKDWTPNRSTSADAGVTFNMDGIAIFYKSNKYECVDKVLLSQRREKFWVQDTLNKALPEDYISRDDKEKFKTALSCIPDLLTNGHVNLDKVPDSEAPMTSRLAQEAMGVGTNMVRLTTFLEWLLSPPTPPGIVVRLQPISKDCPQVPVVIAATHLVSEKALRGEQRRRLELKAIFTDPFVVSICEDASVFVCGDFNAGPTDTKGYPPLAYRYVAGRPVANDRVDEKTVHPFDPCPQRLRSAYRDENDYEPLYSTWKMRMKKGKETEDKHTIDFIFYPDEPEWVVTSRLSFPSEAIIERERVETQRRYNLEGLPSHLPSPRYPSDHFAIMAEFAYDNSQR